MSALRMADYRTAVESLGFVVVEGEGAEPNRTFRVTLEPNMILLAATYECYEDGPFRFGTVHKHFTTRDYLSWPEFITALQAGKK